MQNPRGEEHANFTRRFLGQPLVSVIIPAHNEEKWIADCTGSVLEDSYPNKEVIVVDDGSTDGTSEILKQFPVTVIRNEKLVGPSSARNIGAEVASGEIIVFIDAHCIVEDERWIEKFLEFFRDPEVGAVAGYFKKRPSRVGASLTYKADTNRRLIKSANAAYRKEVFEEVGGFDPSLEWGGDAALTYKVRKSRWKIVHSPEIEVLHAEKLFSIKRAFLYGTCFFPLRRRYPDERTANHLLSSIGMGLLFLLTLSIDALSGLPIFALSLTFLLSAIKRGKDRRASTLRKLKDGFYTTLWSYAYFFGVLYGGLGRSLQG